MTHKILVDGCKVGIVKKRGGKYVGSVGVLNGWNESRPSLSPIIAARLALNTTRHADKPFFIVNIETGHRMQVH